MSKQEFIEVSRSLFVDPDYEEAFRELGLTSIDAVFSFAAAKNLAKANLARHRARMKFEIESPRTTVFLKRYDRPPISAQLRSWTAAHRRMSCGLFEVKAVNKLAAAGIKTPKILFYGEQWGIFFEKRSFIAAEGITDAESLERKLPDYFGGPASAENLRLRRDFIARLADFVKRFHETDYRHRDLYLSHIFYSDSGSFYLIDLARAFKPIVLRRRFRIKDIAQLYYSAPAECFSKTDRLRFYLEYARQNKLTAKNKVFVRRVVNKAKRMARREASHGRAVPFVP